MNAGEILQEGARVLIDRAVQRDCTETGERSMASTVSMFNTLTGHALSEEDGWKFMVLLKMVRGEQGEPRADDYVDLSSYGALLGECVLKNNKEKK